MELIGNSNVIEMEYAVRGPIPARAGELKKQGKKIIPCNIGYSASKASRTVRWVTDPLTCSDTSMSVFANVRR